MYRVICWSLAGIAVVCAAYGDDLPPARFADLTLKILTFDSNLPQRVTKVIKIAVLSSKRYESRATALVAAFEERQTKLVSGYPFTVQVISIDDAQKLRATFNEIRPTCVIALETNEKELRLVSELTREYRVVSITAQKESVNPLSLAFVAERNQVKIYRSDVALSAENVVFPADFLSITRAR
jgi:hypothetical protein